MSNRSAPNGQNYLQLTSSLSQGSDYQRVIRNQESHVVILAPHGGGIEPGTAKIASGIAGEELSLYIFEGLRRQNNRNLHIPSTKFDDPRCLDLVQCTPVAITVHGCGGQEPVVYLGGRNTGLRNSIHRHLGKSGFKVAFDDTHHAGVHPNNLCNRCKSQRGVQLEISIQMRKLFFKTIDRAGRTHPTDLFFRFTQAVRGGISPSSLSS